MKNPLPRLPQIIRHLSRVARAIAGSGRAGLVLLVAGAAFTSPAQSNQCATVASGLIGWWAAEGNAADFTGEHAGSFPYGSAFASGTVGQAFDFDGSFRRVSIADSPEFQLTNAMTLEAWVYPRAYGGFITFRGDNRGGLDNWTVDTYESGFVKFSLIDPDNNVASVRAALALNQWQHIAATWDRASGDLKIYVNGSLGGQTNSPLVPIGVLDAASEPAIGIGNHGGTFHQFPFNGLVDELGIYNRALTSNEVALIFMANSAGKCQTTNNPPLSNCVTVPEGVVSWWRAENNALDEIHTNSGTLLGGMGYAAGRVGQAFVFDGVDDGVVIPDAELLNVGPGQDFTVEAWIQAEPHATEYGVMSILSKRVAPTLVNAQGYDLSLHYGKFGAQLADEDDQFQNFISAGPDLIDGAYHHVALAVNRAATNGGQLFVDGQVVLVFDPTQQSGNLGTPAPLRIGKHASEWFNGSFKGRVDEAAFYRRALAADEISAIYQAGSLGKCASPINPPPPPPPPPATCTNLPPGIISWWQADGNAQDAVAANHGTPTSSTPISSSGLFGQAFQFNGQGDKIELNDPPSLRLTNAFTIEAWILASNAPAGGHAQIFFRGDMRGCFDPYYLSLQPDRSIRLHIGAEDPLNPCGVDLDSPAITLNEWKHVAGVFDGDAGKMRVYIDGTLSAELSTSVRPFAELDPSANPGVAIGNHSRGFSDQGFTGLIDELAVYGRALGANEINAIYNAGAAGKCAATNQPPLVCAPAAPGMVAWWRGENNGLDSIGGSASSLLDGMSFGSGQIGQAFRFDGENDAIRVAAGPVIDVGLHAGFTFEAWINPTRISIGQIVEWNDGVSSTGVHLWHSVDTVAAGDGVANLYANLVDTSGGSHAFWSPSGLVALNVYNHVALTYDKASGLAVLFHNGVAVKTNNLGSFTPQTSYDLYFGKRASGPFSESINHFQGTMDEVSLYSRALSAMEIAAIYNAGSAGKCAPTFLAPLVTQQPQSVTTNVSATVRFEVAATGVPLPAYQWFFGNTPLANQTNAVLIFNNVQLAQAGSYSVQVSNIAGVVFSANAVLSIDLTQPAGLVDANSMGFYNDSLGTTLDGTAPQFPLPFGSGGGDPEFYPADEPNLAAGAAILGNWLTNPASLNSYWRSVTSIPTTWELNTETAIIYVVDGGYHGVSNLRADIDADNGIYVWVNGKYKFGARQPGLPSPLGQYEYTNVYLGELTPGSNYIQILREDSGIADGYQFRLSGTVLATNQSPIITQSPATQTAIGGNAVTFHAAAIGSPELKFQWQFNGVALTGQSNNSLTLANVLLSQAGEYTFVATNPYGAATSAVATLTVLAFPPVITRQPTNTTVIVGNTATLSVQATGSVTLAYQWLRDGSPLAGRTSTSLPFQNIQFSNAGNYSVIVTNLYGAATSSVAVLTVNPIPSCVAVHEGLVSWWKGENNALDNWDSNHGNNQFVNTTTLGKVGRAFSGPFINVNDSPSLRVTNGLTLEAWINPSTLGGVRVLVSKFDYPLFQPGVSQSAYLLGTTNNGALFFTLTPNGSVRTNTTLLTTNLIPLNQWTHVAATYDGSVMRLYFNGLQIGQTNYTGKIFPGGVPLGIGGFAGPSFQTSSPWQYSGLMDEVSLYNRALSAAEIQSIVAADLTGKCLAPPVITQQPQDQTVPLGEDVKFSVGVSGSRPLAYQWCIFRPDPRGIPFTLIPGATNATLIIEKVRTNNVGPYFVIVTNSAGSSYSANAQLSTIPAPTCVDVLPGLISWWPGDTNLLDAIGLNHISTYTPASYPIGKVASAFTFNGVNSRITINNNASLNFGANTNFSIEMWIKANVTNAINPNVPLLEKRDTLSSGWKGYSLSLYKGQLAFALGAASVSTNALYVSSGPDLRDGMFHHVAVTLNRATTNGGVLYVDGAPVLVFDSRVLTNSLVTPGPLYIGGPATTFSNSYFAGLIDEPAIYDRALTAAEILSIRTAGAAGRCKAAPIILTQPVGGAVALGSDYTLAVVATGIPVPRYQWRKGTAPVVGATNATFILTNFSAANAGSYSVAVTNAFGSVISSNAVVGRNFLPIANADALTTPSNTPAVFPSAKLLLNDTDPDGDPLTVTAVSANSAQNGTVSLVSGMLTYSPPANFVGNDTFTYTVGDGRGGTATGTVMATVGNGGAAPLNIVFGPTVEVDQFVVRFAGIPGLTYTIEAAPTPNGPWNKVANLAAPSTDTGFGIGVFEFRETVTGESARYYRTVYPSY